MFQARVPLAWRNLTHHPRRLLVALSGVGFAVVLMFMQTGFRNALFDSTVQVVEKLKADLILVNPAQYSLPAQQRFPLAQIAQARGCPGVKAVHPLYIEVFRAVWTPPRGKGHPIRVLACDVPEEVFLIPRVAEQAERIRVPDTVLLDSASKRDYYGIPDSEDELLRQRGVELCGREIRVVGTFRLGTDFANDGNAIMSTESFARYFPNRMPGQDPLGIVDLGLVQLADGADLPTVQQRLRRTLPADVAVYTKREFIAREIDFWSKATPIGLIFSMGTIIGFLVGMVICYQIIHADVADHVREYATLKAMGYGKAYFIRVVLEEAFYLSVLAFVPGLLISLLLYHALAQSTGLLMMLTVVRGAKVFALTVAMCVASGVLAMRKVLVADPAALF